MSVFDGTYIGADGRANVGLMFHEIFDELGAMSGKYTEHVMHHQDLT